MKSTKKGLVMITTVRPAINRFLIVSLDVIAYCSMKMKFRLIGNAFSFDLSVIFSRNVIIASFRKVELAESFIKPSMREASNFELSAEKRKS